MPKKTSEPEPNLNEPTRSNVPNPEEGPFNFPDDLPQTVDPALAESGSGYIGANPHYADRPHVDPLEAARPAVANDQHVIAVAERETRERKQAQLDREAERAEAEEANAKASAKRNSESKNILTRSEFAELSLEDQAKFRTNNGTVTEDKGYATEPSTKEKEQARMTRHANPRDKEKL